MVYFPRRSEIIYLLHQMEKEKMRWLCILMIGQFSRPASLYIKAYMIILGMNYSYSLS